MSIYYTNMIIRLSVSIELPYLEKTTNCFRRIGLPEGSQTLRNCPYIMAPDFQSHKQTRSKHDYHYDSRIQMTKFAEDVYFL